MYMLSVFSIYIFEGILIFFKACKVKDKVHPRTGHEGPEGEYKYSCTLSLTSALDGDGYSTPKPGRFTPGKDAVPTVQEAGWVPVQVWTSAENLAPTGIRSPDRRTRSVSLYRLRYPGPQFLQNYIFLFPKREL